MYEVLKGHMLWKINYSECCKHKWVGEQYKKVNGKWERTGKWFKADTLEEAYKKAA